MTWKDIIENEQQKPYYEKLKEEIDKRYENSRVFPEKQNIFKALGLRDIPPTERSFGVTDIIKPFQINY